MSFVGTVKWTSHPLGFDALNNLDGHAAALPGIRGGTPRLLYGRAGCDPRVAGEPLMGCISVDEMYA